MGQEEDRDEDNIKTDILIIATTRALANCREELERDKIYLTEVTAKTEIIWSRPHHQQATRAFPARDKAMGLTLATYRPNSLIESITLIILLTSALSTIPIYFLSVY